jgi:hypothetical protein
VVFYGLSIVDEAKWNVLAVVVVVIGPFRCRLFCCFALSKFLVLGVPFAPSLAKSITCDQILRSFYSGTSTS